MKMTDNVQKFILAILDGANQTAAYKSAFDCSRMKDTTITQRAYTLVNKPDVKLMLEKMRGLARERGINKAADVVSEMIAIHSVELTEIVQHRRLCCRHCYGVKHRYQWRDADEFAEALDIYERAQDTSKRSKKAIELRQRGAPTDAGGYGYRFNLPPHKDCPKCWGEGTPDVYIADTRFLTPLQRKAIGSIKQGKEGVEVKLRDQDGSLKGAGQMMGGFKQTFVFENPDGSPLNPSPVLPADPVAAAAAYAEWVKAAKG